MSSSDVSMSLITTVSRRMSSTTRGLAAGAVAATSASSDSECAG